MFFTLRTSLAVGLGIVILVNVFLLVRVEGDHIELEHLTLRADSLIGVVNAIALQGVRRVGPARKVTVSLARSSSLGSANAPIVMVEFADYECPFCKRYQQNTFPQIRQHYVNAGLVRYVLKDLPLPMHTFAFQAALAGRCVARDCAGPFLALS